MKSFILINIQKLLFPAVFLLFTDLAGFSQAVTVKADTTKVSQGISQSTEKINDKALNGNSGNQQANNRNNSGGE